jgi:hypothetical protein
MPRRPVRTPALYSPGCSNPNSAAGLPKEHDHGVNGEKCAGISHIGVEHAGVLLAGFWTCQPVVPDANDAVAPLDV